ncbi:MAG: HalOD1 output domain-containing protein [Halapricum sp.]
MSSEFPTLPDTSTAQGEAIFDLVVAVAEAIGEVEGCSPLAMDEPLFERLDLELLYQLLESMQAGTPVDGSLQFELDDTTVVVSTDGIVTAMDRASETVAYREFECPPVDSIEPTGGIARDA